MRTMRPAYAIAVVLLPLVIASSSVSSPAFAQEAEPSNALTSRAAVPPRQQPPRNPDLVRTGMVLTGLGIFAAVAGMLTLQRAGEDASGNAARLGGGILAGGGVVFAIGIPFWIIGAAPDTDPSGALAQ